MRPTSKEAKTKQSGLACWCWLHARPYPRHAVDDVNLLLIRSYEADTIIISTLQMREQGHWEVQHVVQSHQLVRWWRQDLKRTCGTPNLSCWTALSMSQDEHGWREMDLLIYEQLPKRADGIMWAPELSCARSQLTHVLIGSISRWIPFFAWNDWCVSHLHPPGFTEEGGVLETTHCFWVCILASPFTCHLNLGKLFALPGPER